MEEKTTPYALSSSPRRERLEVFAREHIQQLIRGRLEGEVTALLGRPKSARRAAVDAPAALRNGYGKP